MVSVGVVGLQLPPLREEPLPEDLAFELLVLSVLGATSLVSQALRRLVLSNKAKPARRNREVFIKVN